MSSKSPFNHSNSNIMQEAQASTIHPFRKDISDLFYKRAILCLWLGVIFFSLFSMLDLVCCRELFARFFLYRLALVSVFLLYLFLLRLPGCASYAPHMMYTGMLLGTLTIALMTVELGGLHSNYYIGILLMIAGGFSVLPLRIHEALFTSFSMYLVYLVTVLLGTDPDQNQYLIQMTNNTVFFFSIVAVTTVQSMDDLQTFINSLQATKNIKTLRLDLVEYTDNLEDLVQQRMQEGKESDLKFRDLYNNILDLVILVDANGVIQKVNQHCKKMLGHNTDQLEGKNIKTLLQPSSDEEQSIEMIISHLYHGQAVRGIQLKAHNASGETLDIELSGSLLETGKETTLYQLILHDVTTDTYLEQNKSEAEVHIDDSKQAAIQLILRDITHTKSMERKIIDSERLIDTSRQAAIFGLAKLAECRDDDTGAHLSRIRIYTKILTDELAKNPDLQELITDSFINDILRSCVLHDIGKVGIPDSILLKPGKLTAEEFEQMKQHCLFGSTTLSEAETAGGGKASFLYMARIIAQYHHERWDGNGYPEGLSGTFIPLPARIVALSDVYDALTSTRVYKPPYSHENAKEIIINESGGLFDPSIVNAFLRREQEFKDARRHLLLQ